jgi:ubiquinone/menaquinone biosynthesis C-methylase UbiE
MYISKNPFEVERLRAKLADEVNYSELAKTYSSGYSEIKDQNTSRLWDSLNKDNHTLMEEKNPMLRERLKSVANMINGDNINILNIGFGSGNLEKIYFSTKKNFSWNGIDISRESVIRALKKYPKGKFEIGNITNIKNKDNQFDYVIVLEVLEHIRPRFTLKALGEILRVLKPEGKLIFSVPLNEKLEEMISKGENPNAHVRVYTRSLIKAELSIAGFKILKEKILFAFNKYYKIKTFLSKYVIQGIRHPNNIIILAQKN